MIYEQSFGKIHLGAILPDFRNTRSSALATQAVRDNSGAAADCAQTMLRRQPLSFVTRPSLRERLTRLSDEKSHVPYEITRCFPTEQLNYFVC